MKESIRKIERRTRGRDTGSHISISMNFTQLSLLDQAYSALKESVYDSLVVQTRLKPYRDDIGMSANDEAFEVRRAM
ncbi:MAG: hypothetical protein Q8J80_00390 [Gallionella sp.]|nr:hypothetical protein [Gallionella sp.]